MSQIVDITKKIQHSHTKIYTKSVYMQMKLINGSIMNVISSNTVCNKVLFHSILMSKSLGAILCL